MQVAAATSCKWCYGVEKADVPASYAEVNDTLVEIAEPKVSLDARDLGL